MTALLASSHWVCWLTSRKPKKSALTRNGLRLLWQSPFWPVLILLGLEDRHVFPSTCVSFHGYGGVAPSGHGRPSAAVSTLCNMDRLSIKSLFGACIGVLSLIAVSATANGQVSTSLKKELVWSLPESEIASPQFSPDGNFIVLVSRVHWPDGEEAESLPETLFNKLDARKHREPRFADPIIRLIDLKGNPVCEVRYGTNPNITADNKSIVFSRQRKPITGLRPLAATLAGNDIQLFDCEKKEARTIAEPQTGYFDNPIFLSDGQSIAYTVNEAVNGEMGGAVGVEQVDVSGARKESLLAKEAAPAVRCPTAGITKMTDFQSMMCSQTTKLSSSFPTLVLNVSVAGDQLLVLQAKPIPSAGDMYLASRYQLSLVRVFPKRDEVFSMGQGDMNKAWDASLQPISDGEVMIFAEYWKPFSLETRDWLPQTALRNANPRSIYSPNGKYYLAVEPVKEEASHFGLYRAVDGHKLFTSATMANIFDVAWNRDSTRFAIVAAPKGYSGSAYRNVLAVYSLS